MKSLSLRVAALLSALAAATVSADDIGTAVALADPDTHLAAEVDQLASEIVLTGQVPGLAVALVRNGRVVLERGYGERVAGSSQAVDGNTVFRIASLSKTMTSTLVGVLVDHGYVKWEDRLPDLLPAFQLNDPLAAQNLTLEQLLSHRTGLPYHALDPLLEASSSPLDVLSKMSGVRLSCQPGDCYGYQNVAFSYAADAVFASSGSFFPTTLQRELLTPLGMHTTTVGREAFLESSNKALPHVWGPQGQVAVEPKPNYYWLPAAAGVNSSLHDMTRWLLAQQGYRPDVLPEELLQTLHQPRVETPGESTTSPWRRSRLLSASYGLGFRIFDYQGHSMVFHAGAVQGFRAIMAFVPESDVGMVLLWNSNSGVPGGLLPTVFDRWLGLPAHDWLQLDLLRPALTAQTGRSRASG